MAHHGLGQNPDQLQGGPPGDRAGLHRQGFFVVDRKDLDYQTMREYQRFSPDSVNGSESTAGLKRNLDKDDNKIIVTTIQKLNKLMKCEADLPVYNKRVVFIFDECHRSQFGEAQKNLKKKFKLYMQFGFTGTPIFRKMPWARQPLPASLAMSCILMSSPTLFVMKRC